MTTPLLALAISPDGATVARFGHDFPILAMTPDGRSEPREAAGCCGALAQAVADCQALVCTGIGRGAAGHLAHQGTALVVVAEGTPVSQVLADWQAGRLNPGGEASACDHGHDHAHGHAHAHGEGGCGCHG